MKTLKIILVTSMLLVLFTKSAPAAEASFNKIHFSFTLSGHLLLGLGFERGFDTYNAVQITFFPLLIPGKGLPFAASAGYNYYLGTSRWRPKLGAAFTLLVSPPDPDKRRLMPMLVLTPGADYVFNNGDYLLMQPWLAFILAKAKRTFAPIGMEFTYGRLLR